MRYLALILLLGCNPVKQVLKDPVKFNQVKEAVIRSGACVNDTVTIQTTIDSIVVKDSIIEIKTIVPCSDFDTTLADGTIIGVSSGVLTYRHSCKEKEVIRTTTKTNNIRDRSYESILQKDIDGRDSAIRVYMKLYTDSQLENNGLKSSNTKLKFKFWLLLVAAGLIIFRKPILKLFHGFI